MPKNHKIPGSHKTKGRFISGHPDQLEHRTYQETPHEEAIDRITRLWRPEARAKPGTPHELHRLRGVAGRSDPVQPLDVTPKRKTEPQAPAVGKTVERALGGWVYTIVYPSGEIIDKRKEV